MMMYSLRVNAVKLDEILKRALSPPSPVVKMMVVSTSG